MKSSISAPFIRFPIGTSLIMVGILFVGIIAYQSLPVAPLPKVDFPTIQVTATLPGASPAIMASSVAQPLERQFAQIPGVSQTTSSSGLGITTVVVQFDLDRNIDAAANDIAIRGPGPCSDFLCRLLVGICIRFASGLAAIRLAFHTEETHRGRRETLRRTWKEIRHDKTRDFGNSRHQSGRQLRRARPACHFFTSVH